MSLNTDQPYTLTQLVNEFRIGRPYKLSFEVLGNKCARKQGLATAFGPSTVHGRAFVNAYGLNEKRSLDSWVFGDCQLRTL